MSHLPISALRDERKLLWLELTTLTSFRFDVVAVSSGEETAFRLV
jgi:hypothetical protein